MGPEATGADPAERGVSAGHDPYRLVCAPFDSEQAAGDPSAISKPMTRRVTGARAMIRPAKAADAGTRSRATVPRTLFAAILDRIDRLRLIPGTVECPGRRREVTMGRRARR